MKKIISSVLRVSVSLVLILILLYIMRDKYGDILKALKNTNVLVFLLGLMVFILAISVASLRFQLIVKAQGDIPIIFREALSLTFIGYFFNNFLPTSIGGDVVKAYYLSHKAPREKTGSYASVFVDRVIGLLTMVFMAFVALCFVQDQVIDKNVKYAIYYLTALSVLMMIFMGNKGVAKRFSALLALVKPIEHKLKNIYTAINKYRNHKALLAQSLAISVISQLFYFLGIGIIVASIGSRIPIMDILLRMPIISMISLLPSINGLGVREGSTVLLFGPIIGREKAFVVSILSLLLLFITSIIGGIIYAVSPQFKVKFSVLKKASI